MQNSVPAKMLSPRTKATPSPQRFEETDREIEMTNFLRFWKVLNDFQRSQGLPEVLYGEARGWFAQSGLPE